MRAPGWPPISSSSTITLRTTAPTAAASTAGCAATGRSRSGCFRAFRTSPGRRVQNPISDDLPLEDLRQSAPLAGGPVHSSSSLSPAGLACPAGRFTGRWWRSSCFSFPTLVQFGFGLGRAVASGRQRQRRRALVGFGHARHLWRCCIWSFCRIRRCSHLTRSFARWCGGSSPASGCWNGRPRPRRNCSPTGARRSTAILPSTLDCARGWLRRSGCLRPPHERAAVCRAHSAALGALQPGAATWLNQSPAESAAVWSCGRRISAGDTHCASGATSTNSQRAPQLPDPRQRGGRRPV